MDTATLVATVSSSLFITGSVGGMARWYIKQHSTDSIKEYLAELKPNGGDSLNDAIKLQILPSITELKEDLKELKVDVKEIREENLQITKDVSRLEGRMQAHIEDPRL
jgi:hypothetical protein